MAVCNEAFSCVTQTESKNISKRIITKILLKYPRVNTLDKYIYSETEILAYIFKLLSPSLETQQFSHYYLILISQLNAKLMSKNILLPKVFLDDK